MSKPWTVIQSPTDPEMCAVEGVYLVADNLPIEDAHMIAAAPKLVEALRRIAVAANAGQIDGLTEEAVDAIAGADEALLLAEGRSL